MDPSIKVKIIIAQIQALHNYTVSYRNAWLGKNKATEQIYGNWEEFYNQLPRWLLVMQTFAPGTIIEMETIPVYHEHVDKTWLYDKYKGSLLVAVAHDGNDNSIPIAYALVEDTVEKVTSKRVPLFSSLTDGQSDLPFL
ncbi:uncharacterized protein [Cicer arietinum]|uniref:uncharacterized protein n=1 Tax=Cicer arietinum TaxID=3827 RepID=UPI003CC6ADB0